MTSARARKTTAASARTLRQAKTAGDEETSACELLVAELKARRVRLQHLLKLVHLEVAQSSIAPLPARALARRHSVAMKHIA